jgi:hypothetical protein
MLRSSKRLVQQRRVDQAACSRIYCIVLLNFLRHVRCSLGTGRLVIRCSILRATEWLSLLLYFIILSHVAMFVMLCN